MKQLQDFRAALPPLLAIKTRETVFDICVDGQVRKQGKTLEDVSDSALGRSDFHTLFGIEEYRFFPF